MSEGLTHDKLDWNELKEERAQVLASWPTGREVDLDEALEFHRKLPAELNFAKRLLQAKAEGKTLAQPRAGVADLTATCSCSSICRMKAKQTSCRQPLTPIPGRIAMRKPRRPCWKA